LAQSKLAYIDSLRGLAALYVLAYHFPLITTPSAHVPGWLLPITGAGGSAVILFFIVSAFTLCRSMDARRGDDVHRLVDYAIRRLFRIAPLFFTWIAIYVVRDRLTHGPHHSTAEIVQNLCFVFNLNPYRAGGIVSGSWTIGVEMLFYVLLPFCFRAADTVGKAAALFLLSLVLRMPWHAFVAAQLGEQALGTTFFAMSFLVHLPSFLLGIVVYRLTKVVDLSRLAAHGVGYALTGVFCYVLLTWVYAPLSFDNVSALTIQALIYASLFLGVSLNPVQPFVNRVLGFFGKISFSVYLAHMPLITALSPVFARIYARTGAGEAAYAISMALALVVVTGVAVATYRCIERPGNAAGRKLIALLEHRSQTQAAQQSLA
jgi:peptidoglycan/LPS O-acetylase OafA/YrhL